MSFYNFEWGKENLSNAQVVMEDLADKDGQVSTGIAGVVLASCVVARGRRTSPSARFEELVRLGKDATPLDIGNAVFESWNIVSSQAETTLDAIQQLGDLITPRHLDSKRKKGPAASAKLQAAAHLAYESVLDLWVVVTDYALGLKSAIFRLLRMDDVVSHNEYLHRGMMRSQLEASFGGEFNTEGET